MTEQCSNCRFYGKVASMGERPGALPAGLACFRFPPVFYHFRSGDSTYETGFIPPRVSWNGWCGEWQSALAQSTSDQAGRDDERGGG